MDVQWMPIPPKYDIVSFDPSPQCAEELGFLAVHHVHHDHPFGTQLRSGN